MSPEELYIGQIILHNDYVYRYPVRASDFQNARNRAVFAMIAKMVDNQEMVDLRGLALAMPDVDWIWLSGLTGEVTGNMRRLTDTVIASTRKHKLGVLMRETLESLESDEVSDVVTRLEEGIAEVTEGREEDVLNLADLVWPVAKEFERRKKASGELPGISSGISTLDEITLGFEPRKLYVIGGRPSEGKSALLLHIALDAARKGRKVGLITIESSAFELVVRAFSAVGRIPGQKLRKGMFGGSDDRRIYEAGEALHGMPVVFAEKPNMQIDEVKSRARQMVRQYGCEIVLLDYVQLIQIPGADKEYERVTAASMSMKQLARELSVPLVVAAQLHRGAKENPTPKARKPSLSDFKGSGQIEQDADVAILIYRKTTKEGQEQTWLCVEKNRDGMTGDVQVMFDKSLMSFGAVARDDYA